MPTIPERLRDELEWLRDGDRYHSGGLGFDSAWPRALARTCRGSEAAWWRATFTDQIEVWRRAYEGQPPTSLDHAIALLAQDRLLVRSRVCLFCGKPLEGRRPQAHYCGPDHRRKANYLLREKPKAKQRRAIGRFQAAGPTIGGVILSNAAKEQTP